MKVSRITQITGMTSAAGKPILAALDTDGRIWIADLDELDHRPAWQEVYPIQTTKPPPGQSDGGLPHHRTSHQNRGSRNAPPQGGANEF